jgi:hypothetical protein
MKTGAADNIEAFEIKLEQIPVGNLAEVTETLDRVRRIAKRLIEQLDKAAGKYESGEVVKGRPYDSRDFEMESERIGKGLIALERAMKIVLSAAAAKQKLNSGK